MQIVVGDVPSVNYGNLTRCDRGGVSISLQQMNPEVMVGLFLSAEPDGDEAEQGREPDELPGPAGG